MNARFFICLVCALACSVGLALAVSCDDDDDDVSRGDDDDNDDAGDDDDAIDDDDDVSGDLTWQEPPSDDRWMMWEEAIEYCENLSFDGHDDWRLPTISELRSLIRGCDGTRLGGACGVTDGCTEFDCWNDACGECDSLEGPGSGGAYWPDGMSGEFSRQHWSSTRVLDDEYHGDAWYVDFDFGYVGYDYTFNDNSARCVR